MNSLIPRFARQAAITASRSVAPALAARFATQLRPMSAAFKERVPPEDYYDGHLLADQLEYVDDLIEKTIAIEKSVSELKENHVRFQTGVKWMEAQEIDELLDASSQKKENISLQLAELRKLMVDAKKTFAVDAPDGDSDGHLKEEMLEVKQIIEETARVENSDDFRDAQKTFAVDAPDGDSDGHVKEELAEVRHIIDDAAVLEDKDKSNTNTRCSRRSERNRLASKNMTGRRAS